MPESGGHLTAHRSDPVAQCLGLSPAGPGDVAALCVSDGYASVNVQGWFIEGQTSNVKWRFSTSGNRIAIFMSNATSDQPATDLPP